uniref:Uncharacterized protein n=1 Tax=Arundo donax TaxID=35708 RepID=A0A0A9D3Z7_ARUDO
MLWQNVNHLPLQLEQTTHPLPFYMLLNIVILSYFLISQNSKHV